MTTADVTIDANVIVGCLDPGDSQHPKARAFVESLRDAGLNLILLDFIVEEALSVPCRRSRERKANDLTLAGAIDAIKRWHEAERIQYTDDVLVNALPGILEIVKASNAALNANDAKLVYLQRLGIIGEVATFDQKLSETSDFRAIAFPLPSR